MLLRYLAPKGRNINNPVQAQRSSGYRTPTTTRHPVGVRHHGNVAPLRGAERKRESSIPRAAAEFILSIAEGPCTGLFTSRPYGATDINFD
jgi:hypothetical protein